MNEIIKPEEAIHALVSGFDVLYIDKLNEYRGRTLCENLINVTFDEIEKLVAKAMADKKGDIILIKTNRKETGENE